MIKYVIPICNNSLNDGNQLFLATILCYKNDSFSLKIEVYIEMHVLIPIL